MIEVVRRSVGLNPAFSVVKVSGQRQEGFRPYYLAGLAVRSLMTQRADKGAAALDTLDARELHYLGHVLPSLDNRAAAVEHDEQHRRQAIFDTLVKLTTTLLDDKPLVLLVDDLQFADEGTLVLLKVLVERAAPIFVCGAANETLGSGLDETAPPWERFFETTGTELCVARRRLQPLDADDIRLHLSGVYPGIDLPMGFEAELARTTSGNPLFLGEVLRMLVLDGKLSLAGQRWNVEPLNPGYLPGSLEEIVNRKIASLDEGARNLLEQVSTLGEDVALSVVTGATNVSEGEVLEFLDRARTLGLLRTDFQNNDETMRFSEKAFEESSTAPSSLSVGRRYTNTWAPTRRRCTSNGWTLRRRFSPITSSAPRTPTRRHATITSTICRQGRSIPMKRRTTREIISHSRRRNPKTRS